MEWGRFDDQSKARHAPEGRPAAPTASKDPNRHLRELNELDRGAKRRYRKAIPRQRKDDLEKQLRVTLEGYPQDDRGKGRRDQAEMERLLTKVMATQREYDLAANHLDVRGGGFIASIVGSVGSLFVFLFDWVLLTMSFFILFSSITESWRPAPEITLVGGLSVFFALMGAALVHKLAEYATMYNWARALYVTPWLGAAFGDLYFLNKQGKLNVGIIMTGFLVGLAAVTYFHARNKREQPRPRKDLLRDYDDKYDLFSQHYWHWELTIREMRKAPLDTEVIGDTFNFALPPDYPPDEAPSESPA